jgi:hypothetical protein
VGAVNVDVNVSKKPVGATVTVGGGRLAAPVDPGIGRPAAIAADTVSCVCPTGITVGSPVAIDAPEKESPAAETPIGAIETTVLLSAPVDPGIGRPAAIVADTVSCVCPTGMDGRP